MIKVKVIIIINNLINLLYLLIQVYPGTRVMLKIYIATITGTMLVFNLPCRKNARMPTVWHVPVVPVC